MVGRLVTTATSSGEAARRAGRPRKIRSSGEQDPREEILGAAAELFATTGYLSTTTRQIAARVGITQSSVYSHFGRKEDILAILLERTLDRILEVCDAVGADGVSCDVALWALVCHDARTLCSSSTNIASLLLVPEVRGSRFESMWSKWHRLQDHYRRLLADGLEAGVFVGDHDVTGHLVFNLTGTMVWFDRDTGTDVDALACTVADSALRMVLARAGRLATVARRGRTLVAEFDAGRRLAEGNRFSPA